MCLYCLKNSESEGTGFITFCTTHTYTSKDVVDNCIVLMMGNVGLNYSVASGYSVMIFWQNTKRKWNMNNKCRS